MRIRTILAASALAATTVLGGASAAAAEDDNGFQLVKTKDINVGCLIPVLVINPGDNPLCPS
jgi:hypothetical protein